jgi:hypothetical protein
VNWIYCHDLNFPPVHKESIHLKHDHEQARRYIPEIERDIGSIVAEIHPFLNILVVPPFPFEITLEPNGRFLELSNNT